MNKIIKNNFIVQRLQSLIKCTFVCVWQPLWPMTQLSEQLKTISDRLIDVSKKSRKSSRTVELLDEDSSSSESNEPSEPLPQLRWSIQAVEIPKNETDPCVVQARSRMVHSFEKT